MALMKTFLQDIPSGEVGDMEVPPSASSVETTASHELPAL